MIQSKFQVYVGLTISNLLIHHDLIKSEHINMIRIKKCKI